MIDRIAGRISLQLLPFELPVFVAKLRQNLAQLRWIAVDRRPQRMQPRRLDEVRSAAIETFARLDMEIISESLLPLSPDRNRRTDMGLVRLLVLAEAGVAVKSE